MMKELMNYELDVRDCNFQHWLRRKYYAENCSDLLNYHCMSSPHELYLANVDCGVLHSSANY